MKLKFYEDPGHGWLAVPMIALYELEIVDKVSPYSYIRGLTAYLEEDCDYSTFAAAMRAAGRECTVTRKHTDRRSPIRSYRTYNPALVYYAIKARLGVGS